ncbi:MAG TPA: outer membrane beta-barrel protein [Steroidobacteraceae bacterium]|nr:outer membrane beta-barrel protein [Steroidobacteraceae bacterium]
MGAAAEAAPVLDISLRAGDTYTDNVNVSGSAPEDDHVAGLATRINLDTRRERLEAHLTADLTYLNYLQNTYDSQFRRGANGSLILNFLNGHVAWIVTDNYGAVLEDPLSAERPDNLTYDNYVTTGPQIVVGNVAKLHARGSFLYGRADFGADDIPDNEQYSGDFALILPATQVTESSLNVRMRRIRQDPDAAPLASAFDYDFGEAFLRISRRAARSEIYAEAGATRLDAEGDSSTTPLSRVGFVRRVTPRISLDIAGGIQYQDSLGRFQRLQDAAGEGSGGISDPRGDVIDTASPMRDRFIDLGLFYDGIRTTAYLTANYNKVDVERSADLLGNQEYASFGVGIERRIRPTWSLDMAAEYNRRNLGGFGRRDENVFVQIGSTWHLQPKLDLRLAVYRRERHSKVLDGDYEVSSAQLEIVYWPRNSSRARQR